MSEPLHLLGRFDDPHAGAERSVLELGRLLAGRRDVRFWSDVVPHPWYGGQGVRHIQPGTLDVPQGGLLVFAGVHVQAGAWLPHARAERLLVRYNLPNHGALFAMIEQLRDATGLEPEIVFVSRALQAAVGLPGVIEPGMIRLDPFLVVPLLRRAGRPFTLGRASRDVPEKHHPQDPSLYRMLAAQGHRIRIMGGTCLAAELAGIPGIELLAAGAEPVADFFASLDVMFYRTGSFYEAYGRVIFEAMASGLPVVASTRGGYVEWVQGDHGVVLIDSQEQAMHVFDALSADPALREALGSKARQKALLQHGEAAIQETLTHYLG